MYVTIQRHYSIINFYYFSLNAVGYLVYQGPEIHRSSIPFHLGAGIV